MSSEPVIESRMEQVIAEHYSLPVSAPRGQILCGCDEIFDSKIEWARHVKTVWRNMVVEIALNNTDELAITFAELESDFNLIVKGVAELVDTMADMREDYVSGDEAMKITDDIIRRESNGMRMVARWLREQSRPPLFIPYRKTSEFKDKRRAVIEKIWEPK